MLYKFVLLIALSMIAVACSGDTTDSTEAPEVLQSPDATTTTTEPAPPPTTTTAAVAPSTTTSTDPGSANVLAAADSDLGPILVDGDGNVLYLFTPDTDGVSTCYGDCEANWPVFYGPVEDGDGVDDDLIGSTTRDDGTEQVTYDGWPLYYFIRDEAPGDTNGQGVGDVWYVVSPNSMTLTAAESDLGSILTDGDGNVLYLFTPDTDGISTCYGDCEINWPVFTGPVFAGEGVDAALIGYTIRDNGSVQATYNGWPLYYFIRDEAPGDTNGQGVGEVWYVVDPSGAGVGS